MQATPSSASRDFTTERLYRRFQHTLEVSAADPFAFLPEWCRQMDPETLKSVPIICCGANALGLSFLAAASELNIIGVVDDFKKGQGFFGHSCIGMAEFVALAKKTPNAICVNMAQWDPGVRFFANLGRRFKLRMISFWEAVRLFDVTVDFRVADRRPTILARASEFLSVESMLCDELSKQTLFTVLTHFLDNDRENILSINRPFDAHYFRSGLFDLNRDEIFVDCGAAVGETVDHFMEITEENFRGLYAFEPDRENFSTLQAKIDRYRNLPFYNRIHLRNKATGARNTKVYFEHGGGEGSRVIEGAAGDNAMDLVRLDSELPEGATFLKLDVEGHELDTLKGAEETIRRCKPRIAVCVYHKDDDLLTIPAYLKSLNPDYRIGLRHCNPVRFDTICFAF
jgi:FkbM family methyltransferase